MKQGNKRFYLGRQGAAVLSVLLGILLVVNPDFGTSTVGLTVGIVLAAFGGVMLVISAMSWPVLGFWEIAIGLAALLSGIALIRQPTLLGKMLGYVISAALILRGAQALSEAKKLKKLGYDQKRNTILALVMLVLGAVLFAVPLTSSRILMRLVGAAVLVLGIANIGTQASYAKKIRISEKDIVDADE